MASVTWADQEVEIARRFTGKIADPDLAAALPDSGIIDNVDALKELWIAWRPNDPVHNVDFQNQIVLVETVPGPNMVFSSTLKLNEQGDLKYETASARVGGPGFGYLIMVIPKTGIKTINGKSLDGKPIESKPMVASPDKRAVAAQPEPRPPTTIENVRDGEPSIGAPGVDPTTANSEFVNVEIVGRVRAQFESVGAETTGTLVAADGIVWELDLQQDEQLMEVARQLGNSLARITGKLKMQRQRGSLEARVRWIVLVDSFQPLGIQSTMPPATRPSERPTTQPQEPQAVADNSRVDQAPPESEQVQPGNERPPLANPLTQPPDSPLGGVKVPVSFKRLSIATSDGQLQTIDSNGSVHYESKSRNMSNDWAADRSTLAKLSQFVAETAWGNVPKLTRSQSNDPNEISYTISIETPRGVTRVFIDRTAVADEPTLKRLFEIISEVARNR